MDLDMTAHHATQFTPEIPSEREFDLLVDAFLARYSGNTRREYARDIRMFREWCVEIDMHPFEVRRRTIEAYVRHMTDTRGNQPRSVNRRIISLRQFYEFAIDDDYIVKAREWREDPPTASSSGSRRRRASTT